MTLSASRHVRPREFPTRGRCHRTATVITRSFTPKQVSPSSCRSWAKLTSPNGNDVSLLEVRGGTFIADRFRALRLEDGLLQTQNLPSGEYDLWLKGVNRHILLRVLPGKRHRSHILGQTRLLEVRDDDPLQISSLTSTDESVEIQLQNASKFSRIHVISTRYLPTFSPFSSFGVIGDPEPYVTTVPAIESYYVAGRVIGDELRYILDRKYAKRFAGNSLKRPSLLLNPWAVRTTSTGHQDAAKGGEFGSKATNEESNSGRGSSKDNTGGQKSRFQQPGFSEQRLVRRPQPDAE